MTERFRDDGRTLEAFVEPVLVLCPRCGRPADVRADAVDGDATPWTAPHRLVCSSCQLVREHDGRSRTLGVPRDPWFDAPLLLQARCAGHTLWAYNADHLSSLTAFVRATLRERPLGDAAGRPASMVERLPTWITSAEHRRAVSRALVEIAGRLPR